MNYVERDPPVYTAVQFNKEGDHPLVKRGYRTKNNLIASDALPRSPECRFAWILSGPHNFEEIKIGNWLVSEPRYSRIQVFTDEAFHQRFMAQPSQAEIYQ